MSASVPGPPILPEDGRAIALARYRAAVARTDALIEGASTPKDKTPAEIRARAEERLDRLRRFLAHLGDPHRAFPIVHVGGTSGKGSTATAIAAILGAAGYRVGLHTSPYLQAATEKLQVGGRLIAPGDFAGLVDEVLAARDAWPDGGALTYGEVWVALVAVHLARERVDIGVIEVGAGGRFDLTNVVTPSVSVVTTVGLDHTVTLGETIPEIAWHKAGIVKAGAPAITAARDPAALGPIAAEARAVGTPLTRVIAGETYAVVDVGPDGTRWRELGPDGRPGPEWPAPPGRFQATNAATAVAAVRALAGRGFAIPEDAIRRGLAAARVPGRWERMPGAPRVVLDGAHNPDKVAAVARDLPDLLPRPAGGRLILVLGAIEAKRYDEIVRILAPLADALIATSPSVLAKPGAAAADLASAARHGGFAGPLDVEPDPDLAVSAALAHADRPGDAVLVTGSLYLIGNVRGRWYPDDAVVLGRSPWPGEAVGGERTGDD